MMAHPPSVRSSADPDAPERAGEGQGRGGGDEGAAGDAEAREWTVGDTFRLHIKAVKKSMRKRFSFKNDYACAKLVEDLGEEDSKGDRLFKLELNGDSFNVLVEAPAGLMRNGHVKLGIAAVDEDVVMRRRALREALSLAGLKFRSNSSLCKQYVQPILPATAGTPDIVIKPRILTVEQVVRRMAELTWLNKYTDFEVWHAEYYDRALDEEREDFGEEAGDEWGIVGLYDSNYGESDDAEVNDSDYDSDGSFACSIDSHENDEYRSLGAEASAKAERKVLRRKGGWPARWPWLPPAQWTCKTHKSKFPLKFQEQARAVVLSLPRALGVDARAAAPLSERIIANLAALNHVHV